jgi:outer membrane protein assembly factor BamB
MRPLVPLAVLLLLASTAQGLEWPQFHADAQHTGAVQSDFAPPTQLWWSRSTGGPIEGSPVVSDGRVFIGSTDGKLYAFDAISGSPLWTFDAGSPISGTPAMSGGILYLVSNGGKLVALDAVTGKQRLSAGSGNPDPGASRTSPAIHQGRLYIGTESGTLIAYSLEHLTRDWEFRYTEETMVSGAPVFNNVTNDWMGTCSTRFVAKPIRSSPAVHNNRVYFGSDVHALFAVDEFGLGGSDAGKTQGVWRLTPNTSNYSTLACPKSWPVKTFQGLQNYPMFDDVIRASPAIAAGSTRDLVIVPAFDNTIRAFDAATGSQVWNRRLGNHSTDRSAATPAVGDGKVFFGALNGKFYAFDAATGADAWPKPFAAKDAVWSSAAFSNGLVAFGADDETIYVLDAATGAERWRHRIGGDVRSSPAIWTGDFLGTPLTGGVLYVGGADGILYAFGGAKPPLPDLRVTNITVPTDPVLPLDSIVDVNVTVLNAGNSTSPATELKLFIDGALASTQPVKALGPGESTSLVYAWKVPANNHTILAIVDPSSVSREFDRGNNELRIETPVARAPPPPPEPEPEEAPQEQQQQQEAPKKKSPGFEVLALAGAALLVALARRRRA